MYAPTREQIAERWQNLPEILKEGMHSEMTLNEIDAIEQNFHLSEEKADEMARLMRGVFYGFIHFDGLYKEIKDSLNIDPRLALDIYHELDKKVFESFKKEIEDNYIKHKVGIVKESEMSQPKAVPAQVVLKEGPEVINLKPEPAVAQPPVKLKVEGLGKPAEPAPMPIGQIGIKPEPITVVSSATPKPPVQPIAPQPRPPVVPPKPSSPAPQTSEGPMIIHKMEESQSVVQSQAASSFRQASFGGYRGSFRAFSGQSPQAPISSARVEMPSEKKPEIPVGMSEQKVPVVVKKYEEEPVKTIHYSDLRTPLAPKGEEKPQTPPVAPLKKEPPQGMIDLTNLTFRK